MASLEHDAERYTTTGWPQSAEYIRRRIDALWQLRTADLRQCPLCLHEQHARDECQGIAVDDERELCGCRGTE